ncbi:hypothetical protein [Roseibium sp. M-1]
MEQFSPGSGRPSSSFLHIAFGKILNARKRCITKNEKDTLFGCSTRT